MGAGKVSILIAILMWLASLTQPAMPVCEEDQVIVGAGDFEAGRWTAYVCGPALDDIAAHKLGQRIADAETQPVVVEVR